MATSVSPVVEAAVLDAAFVHPGETDGWFDADEVVGGEVRGGGVVMSGVGCDGWGGGGCEGWFDAEEVGGVEVRVGRSRDEVFDVSGHVIGCR